MVQTATVSPVLLRNVPLFSSLSEEQLQVMCSSVTRKRYPKNSIIMSSGDAIDSLYIIISGSIKVSRNDTQGKEIILSVLGQGEYFGEMGLIDENPRSANIVATEPCELIIITKENFRKYLAENFDMAMVIMRGLVKRLRDADKKIESLALMDVYGRVARVLLDFSQNVNGQLVVSKKLPKQDIAKMIGASREMVSRVMKDLETSGYIEVKPGKIFLKEQLHSTSN